MNNFSGNQLPTDLGQSTSWNQQNAPILNNVHETRELSPATEVAGSLSAEQQGGGAHAPGLAQALGTAQTPIRPIQQVAGQQPAQQPASGGMPQVGGGGFSPALSVPVPEIADDADLIEKEWVEKAKEIVERTRSDPYKQTKEIQKFRADYIKKRYNKDIKIDEEK